MVKPMTERMTVVGVFHNAREAQAAIRDLKAAGFRDDEIGVIGPGDSEADFAKGTGRSKSKDGGTHAGEGAAAGAATGAGLGALWGIGIAAGLLPAIGPVIAGGVLASILASAAGAAAVGGLAGALVGLGIPEEEAHYYENEFRAGRTIVTVKTTTRQDEARRILGSHSAYDMESRPDRAGAPVSRAKRNTPSTRTSDVEGQRVQLREEELRAEKNVRPAGEARIHKDVVTEHRSIDVPVEREEVVIERHPAHGRATSGPITTGEEIRIPVKEEEVQVTKTPVVKEEVSVGKRKVTETKHVDADVKHEELRVDDTTGRTTGKRGPRRSR